MSWIFRVLSRGKRVGGDHGGAVADRINEVGVLDIFSRIMTFQGHFINTFINLPRFMKRIPTQCLSIVPRRDNSTLSEQVICCWQIRKISKTKQFDDNDDLWKNSLHTTLWGKT